MALIVRTDAPLSGIDDLAGHDRSERNLVVERGVDHAGEEIFDAFLELLAQQRS